MTLPPPCFTVGMVLARWWVASFRHEAWHSGIRVLQVPFGILQVGCHVPLTEEWLLPGHSMIQAWLMERCRDGSPSERFSSLDKKHWSSVRETVGFLVTALTKALPQSFSLARQPALGRVLVVSNFFHSWIIEASVVIATSNPAEMFQYPSPDLCLDTILSRRSTENSFNFMAWFGLWCALSAVGPLYRQVCAFPNHIQSTEFTTGGLQSSCRNISRMISWNRMHLSSILSVRAKAMNTYVHDLCLIFNTFAKKNIILSKIMDLIHFGIML